MNIICQDALGVPQKKRKRGFVRSKGALESVRMGNFLFCSGDKNAGD